MSHFFFDANMSWRLCNMIAALETDNHHIIHITQDLRFTLNNNRFGNSTPDVEWLRILGRDKVKWVAISGDTSIIDTAHERAALIASGLTFFAFDDHFANADAHSQALKLIRMWPDLVKLSLLQDPGIYVVRTGKKPWVEKIRVGMKASGGES